MKPELCDCQEVHDKLDEITAKINELLEKIL